MTILNNPDPPSPIWCTSCEREATALFGCETCGRYACAACLRNHEPCDGTHPEGDLGKTPRELLPAEG